MTSSAKTSKTLAACLLTTLLLAGGCEESRTLYEIATGNTALRNARRLQDSADADERREGINFLVDHRYGQAPPYTTQYREMAVQDKDHLVRATAVRALNRSRDSGATDVFIQAMNDPHPLVRLEAAKALANLPDERAVPVLIEHLAPTFTAVEDRRPVTREEDKDVRIAAARALRHYRKLDAARALTDVLDDRDFGVAWQARRSLRSMTGQDHFYSEGAWLGFLTGPEKPLG